MIHLLALTPAQATLMTGSRNEPDPSDPVIRFILCNSWAAATTRQYAAAVNKFVKFVSKLTNDEELLLASSHRLYHFILWCSTSGTSNVSSNTIRRYFTGLHMWHMLHDFGFPVVSPHRIRLLLKACTKKQITRAKWTQIGLLLQDVLDLADAFTTENRADLVTKAIILIIFWGLARLGELTLHRARPPRRVPEEVGSPLFERRKIGKATLTDGKDGHTRRPAVPAPESAT